MSRPSPELNRIAAKKLQEINKERREKQKPVLILSKYDKKVLSELEGKITEADRFIIGRSSDQKVEQIQAAKQNFNLYFSFLQAFADFKESWQRRNNPQPDLRISSQEEGASGNNNSAETSTEPSAPSFEIISPQSNSNNEKGSPSAPEMSQQDVFVRSLNEFLSERFGIEDFGVRFFSKTGQETGSSGGFSLAIIDDYVSDVLQSVGAESEEGKGHNNNRTSNTEPDRQIEEEEKKEKEEFGANENIDSGQVNEIKLYFVRKIFFDEGSRQGFEGIERVRDFSKFVRNLAIDDEKLRAELIFEYIDSKSPDLFGTLVMMAELGISDVNLRNQALQKYPADHKTLKSLAENKNLKLSDLVFLCQKLLSHNPSRNPLASRDNKKDKQIAELIKIFFAKNPNSQNISIKEIKSAFPAGANIDQFLKAKVLAAFLSDVGNQNAYITEQNVLNIITNEGIKESLHKAEIWAGFFSNSANTNVPHNYKTINNAITAEKDKTAQLIILEGVLRNQRFDFNAKKKLVKFLGVDYSSYYGSATKFFKQDNSFLSSSPELPYIIAYCKVMITHVSAYISSLKNPYDEYDEHQASYISDFILAFFNSVNEISNEKEICAELCRDFFKIFPQLEKPVDYGFSEKIAKIFKFYLTVLDDKSKISELFIELSGKIKKLQGVALDDLLKKERLLDDFIIFAAFSPKTKYPKSISMIEMTKISHVEDIGQYPLIFFSIYFDSQPETKCLNAFYYRRADNKLPNFSLIDKINEEHNLIITQDKANLASLVNMDAYQIMFILNKHRQLKTENKSSILDGEIQDIFPIINSVKERFSQRDLSQQDKDLNVYLVLRCAYRGSDLAKAIDACVIGDEGNKDINLKKNWIKFAFIQGDIDQVTFSQLLTSLPTIEDIKEVLDSIKAIGFLDKEQYEEILIRAGVSKNIHLQIAGAGDQAVSPEDMVWKALTERQASGTPISDEFIRSISFGERIFHCLIARENLPKCSNEEIIQILSKASKAKSVRFSTDVAGEEAFKPKDKSAIQTQLESICNTQGSVAALCQTLVELFGVNDPTTKVNLGEMFGENRDLIRIFLCEYGSAEELKDIISKESEKDNLAQAVKQEIEKRIIAQNQEYKILGDVLSSSVISYITVSGFSAKNNNGMSIEKKKDMLYSGQLFEAVKNKILEKYLGNDQDNPGAMTEADFIIDNNLKRMLKEKFPEKPEDEVNGLIKGFWEKLLEEQDGEKDSKSDLAAYLILQRTIGERFTKNLPECALKIGQMLAEFFAQEEKASGFVAPSYVKPLSQTARNVSQK